jgi:hypothetical protein
MLSSCHDGHASPYVSMIKQCIGNRVTSCSPSNEKPGTPAMLLGGRCAKRDIAISANELSSCRYDWYHCVE